MVKVWTNDIYVSNPHRVANRTGKERYSIPTFFNLDYDTPVACLPQFQSSENPPRHAPVKSGDYLVKRLFRGAEVQDAGAIAGGRPSFEALDRRQQHHQRPRPAFGRLGLHEGQHLVLLDQPALRTRS